jgi:putative NADPH-quinone reductase
LRALIVHAHPSPQSFSAALFHEVAATLTRQGHDVEICDLYAENFDPVLPLATFRRYLDPAENRAGVETFAQRLKAAEALIFVFPVWHDGPPAILKGYFDRVFVRGVAFEIVDGVFYPTLQNVRRLGAVALYGADRERTRKVGDLPRRFFRHNLGALVAPDARRDYIAGYGMDRAGANERAALVEKVRRVFRKW